MKKEEPEIFYPETRAAWRQWLLENHKTQRSVWLVQYKKQSGKPSVSWSDAVDEALCFGWIDSKAIPVDEEKFMQFFSRRKPGGTWSGINKEKIKKLNKAGLMTAAGRSVIRAAKKDGSWTILDDVEKMIVPPDLDEALGGLPGANDFFRGLSKSVRKHMLQWIVLARQPATRQQRIRSIAEAAAEGRKPPNFPG